MNQKPTTPGASEEPQEVHAVVRGGEREVLDLTNLAAQQQSLVEFVERRNVLLERALPLAIGVTKAEHWFKFGNSFWPTAAACQRIMRRFAVTMDQSRVEKVPSSDEKGAYYVYNFYARFSLPGGLDSIEALGSASSRNKFFAMKDGQLRPLFEIHEPNIIKAARSNCMANGVQELLGIKGTTEADLKAAGVPFQKIQEVKFDGKDKARGSGDPAKKAQATGSKGGQQGAPAATGEDNALDRGAVIPLFLKLIDYLSFRDSCSENVWLSKYLPFKEPDQKTGATHAERRMVERFKTQKALKWLVRQGKKIRADEDLSGLAEWEADTARPERSKEPAGDEPPPHGDVDY